jgi:hypothetical protein
MVCFSEGRVIFTSLFTVAEQTAALRLEHKMKSLEDEMLKYLFEPIQVKHGRNEGITLLETL